MSAYCETCAAIAQVYLNYRLFLLHGDSKYYDALERTLYNGVISGISIDGGTFFYLIRCSLWGSISVSPGSDVLAVRATARFIPSLPQYIYAVKDDALYINLFNGNTVTTKVAGKAVTLERKPTIHGMVT